MFNNFVSFLKRRKFTITILVLLGLLGFFGFRKFIAPKPIEYKTKTVQTKDLVQIVTASGEIKSEEEVTLRFQTSGYLTWVGVKKWDKVKKWQAIASLDKKALEKTLKQELIDYMNERWDYEEVTRDTYKDLPLTDTIKRAKESGQFDMDRTVLDVEIADIALKYATLISPIDGIVTDIEAPHAGVNITPATAEFTIANPDKLVFGADVDEADIGKTKVGQKASIILDAYSEEEIASSVEQIEFIATTTSGGGTAFIVKFKIPGGNLDEKYKLDMNGDVQIKTYEKKGVLAVPIEAVQEKEDRKIVEIIENGKIKEVEVNTGLETDTEIEITYGLKIGQKVIVEKKTK